MIPVLAGSGLAFGHDTPLFRDLDLAVDPGSCCALLGANGAGKTTLLRVLAGLRPPCAGTLLLHGAPLASIDAAERARRIGILPQATPTAEGFTANELVLMGLYATMPARGWEGRREWSAVARALRRVGAAHVGRRPFTELSGGEQRRVLLARALVSVPDLLLLDEPLASLDPGFALETIAVLEEVKQRGTAMVVATHDLRLASRLADDIVLMRSGRPARRGPASELLAGPLLDETYGTSAFRELRRGTAAGALDRW